MKLRQEFFTLLRYGLVGIANTVLSAGIMIFLAHLGMEYHLYSTIAYLVGIVASFALNSRFTFGIVHDAAKRRLGRFALFLGISLGLLGLTQVIQTILVEIVHLNEALAVGCGMAAYTGLGFIINRCLTFRPARDGQNQGAKACPPST